MPEVKRRHEKIVKNKLDFKECTSAFGFLYYWGKFIGVNPLSLSEANELKFSYKGLFYGCSVGLLYCYISRGALFERFKVFLPSEPPIAAVVDFIRIGWQCLYGSSAWFVFAIYQNRAKLIIKSFVKVERISRKLGIPEDYEKHFKLFQRHLIVHNILCLGSLIFSDIMWSRSVPYERLMLRIFNILLIAPFNMIMLFVWSLSLVKRKFYRLNEKVRLLMQSESVHIHETDEERSQSLLIINSSWKPQLQPDTIYMISQVHRDLRIIIHRIERHFATVILFGIANFFTHTTLTIYRLYRYIKEHCVLEGMAFDLLGANIHQLIYPAAMLIIISNICDSTVNTANNSSNMLHAMINNCKTISGIRIPPVCNLLFFDLLQNKVSMSIHGLFKLDNFLVYSVVASVTGYLAIMLQLQD